MLNFALIAKDSFVLATMDGLVSVEAWDEVLKQLAAAIENTGAPPRLLIDITGVLGYLGTPERRAVGTLMAQNFTGMEKVALFVQAHKITDVVSGEAQRLGLNLRLFPEYDDAVAWVSS